MTLSHQHAKIVSLLTLIYLTNKSNAYTECLPTALDFLSIYVIRISQIDGVNYEQYKFGSLF